MSFMQRMGFVMRKAAKTAKKWPPKFGGDTKGKISSTAAENSITADLISNWDQTGVQMVPENDYPMTSRGSNLVFLTGLDDRRDKFFSNKCPF